VGRAVPLFVVLMACALVLPRAASAEPIVALGLTAGPPSAVTDGAGTLHAVWRDGSHNVGACEVPAGGTACTPRVIAGFQSFVGNPHLMLRPQDGALIVVVAGSDDAERNVTFALTSLDGGATWSAPAIVGIGRYVIDHAALTPDGAAVDTLEDSHDMAWQRVPLAGPPETRIVSLRSEPSGARTSFSFDGNVAFLPDGRPMIVAYSSGSSPGGVRYRVLRPRADPYVNASWTSWSAAPALSGVSADVAFGPNGIWAMTQDSIAAGQDLRVWRFDGRRFARPRALGTIGGRATTNVVGDKPVIGGGLDFAQDAGGRLHVAWARSDICGRGRECLVYRRNEPRGFGPPVIYPLPLGARRPATVSIAANEGGSGWMVWRENGAAPTFATPLATPPRGSRIGSRRIGRSRRVTVPTHYACVAPGGRFVHRALVSGRRRGVTIVSVRFSFDGGQLARTDHRSPYRIVYRLTFAAGTRHVAEARITYRLNGRTRHTSVGRAIVMCP
jgi:hypothetical protein